MKNRSERIVRMGVVLLPRQRHGTGEAAQHQQPGLTVDQRRQAMQTGWQIHPRLRRCWQAMTMVGKLFTLRIVGPVWLMFLLSIGRCQPGKNCCGPVSR